MSLLANLLHLIKDFLLNDGRMGVVENLLIFFGIFPLLLIPNGIGVGLEVDRCADIFFSFKNIDYGAFVPAVRILRLGVRCFHALLIFICSRREYLVLFKLFCDLARSTPIHAKCENLFDHLCGFFVDDPFFGIVGILHVAIRHMNSQSLATLTFCFLHRTNLATRVLCKKLIEPVFDTGDVAVGAVRIDAVIVVVDGNVANIVLRECVVDVQSSQGGVTTKSG